jgi:hypothetical protein
MWSRSDLARRAMTATGVAALVLVSGCARDASHGSAQAALHAFARALSEGDAERSYALMSSEFRKRVSFAAWQKQLQDNATEASEVGDRLARTRGPAVQQSVLRDEAGRELRLEREGDSWKVSSNLIDFYDQSTPRAALRAFVDALTRKRYDVVLRLMPNADKEGVTTESMAKAWGYAARDDVERMLTQLRSHIEEPIEIVGNYATMPYAERLRVQFVREEGRWKIEDPE